MTPEELEELKRLEAAVSNDGEMIGEQFKQYLDDCKKFAKMIYNHAHELIAAAEERDQLKQRLEVCAEFFEVHDYINEINTPEENGIDFASLFREKDRKFQAARAAAKGQ
jgi:hypothetical protein